MKGVPQPVQSYTLFDPVWSVKTSQTIAEGSAEAVAGSPIFKSSNYGSNHSSAQSTPESSPLKNNQGQTQIKGPSNAPQYQLFHHNSTHQQNNQKETTRQK